MNKEYKSECFDNALNKFLNHIESLWTSMPIVLRTIEMTKKNAETEHQNFLDANCEFVEAEQHYLVKVEHLRKNKAFRKAVGNSAIAMAIIKRNFLVSLVSQFDMYIGDMIKAIFEVRPEIINNSEKQLTFSELAKFIDIREA